VKWPPIGPDLQFVARAQLPGEVRRDLPVVDALDRQRDLRILGRRRDRVRALGLVAVLGRQAHVDVLTGDVPGPVGDVEHERLGVRVLGHRLAHGGQAPDDRRSRQGQSLQ
jgi:hypothetical protein